MNWFWSIRASLLLVFAGLSACGGREQSVAIGRAHPLDVAFWVWNRSKSLTDDEFVRLKAMKVEKIYWQIGELEIGDGGVHSKAQWPLPNPAAGIDFVPVIRLESSISDPSLIDPVDLARWAKKAGVGESLQFDYDCPSRLLSAYADLLEGFRVAYGPIQLSTTALGAWCESEQWRKVESAVDAVYPMFYDVLPEQKQNPQKPDEARALVDSEYLIALIRKWDRSTSIPWQAGLPNFTRLSIFRNGKPRGHIRSWLMEDLLLNPDLSYEGSGAPGVSFFKVNADTRVGQVILQRDEWLCFRNCDRGELRLLIETLRNSSAAGIVWFQMPRQGLASNGWSFSEIDRQFAGKTDLRVNWQEDRLVLQNVGDGDLAPDFEQGHELRLSWPQPILRECITGDFLAAEFLQNGREVPVVGALELKFSFPGLAAGQSMSSGLLLFSHDKNRLAVKYQIDDNAWKPLSINR